MWLSVKSAPHLGTLGITEEENCRFFNFYTEICFTKEGCQISKDLEYFYSEIHVWMKEAGKKVAQTWARAKQAQLAKLGKGRKWQSGRVGEFKDLTWKGS